MVIPVDPQRNIASPSPQNPATDQAGPRPNFHITFKDGQLSVTFRDELVVTAPTWPEAVDGMVMHLTAQITDAWLKFLDDNPGFLDEHLPEPGSDGRTD